MKTSSKIGTHYTSSTFIVHEDKVLLLKHKKRNSWLAPGGHVEENELPHETALREAKEETGLDIELIDFDAKALAHDTFLQKNDKQVKYLPKPWHIILEKQDEENHYHIDLLYIAKPKNTKISNNENHDLKWFSKTNLEEEKNIFPNAKYFAKLAIKETNPIEKQFKEAIEAIRKIQENCPSASTRTLDEQKKELLDEAIEVKMAVDKKDWKNLEEELGDVLWDWIVFCRIAEKQNLFKMEDVFQGLLEKSKRRNPHIFSNAIANTKEEVENMRQEIKKREKRDGLR